MHRLHQFPWCFMTKQIKGLFTLLFLNIAAIHIHKTTDESICNIVRLFFLKFFSLITGTKTSYRWLWRELSITPWVISGWFWKVLKWSWFYSWYLSDIYHNWQNTEYLQGQAHECVDERLWVDVELRCSQEMLMCQSSCLMLSSCL